MADNVTDAAHAKAGKHLAFRVGDETYGIDIMRVQEIIGVLAITRVPSMPESIRGVINLRGRVMPVIDLRVKFGVREAADHERNCIIVLQVTGDSRSLVMGVLVDEVSEVVEIAAAELGSTPDFGSSIDASFLTGLATTGETVTMLLDADKLLASTDLETIAALHGTGDAA